MALKIDTAFKGVPIVGAYVTVVRPTIIDKNGLAFNVLTRASPSGEPLMDEHYSAPYVLEGKIRMCRLMNI
jgi:hypothetical protein